jgi:hypothetical protein
MDQVENTKIGAGCGTLIGYGVVLLLCWFAVAYLLPNEWRIKYAMSYLVSYENVTVLPRPTGCDFWHAPIGVKSCHYEREVSKVTWRKSNDGKPEVSYDEGKTWEPREPAPEINVPADYVFVGWNKVEDP